MSFCKCKFPPSHTNRVSNCPHTQIRVSCERIGYPGRTITDLQGEEGQRLLSELEEVSETQAQQATHTIAPASNPPFVIFDETAPQNAPPLQQEASEPVASAGPDAPGGGSESEGGGLGVGLAYSENLRALGIVESCYLCKQVFESLGYASGGTEAASLEQVISRESIKASGGDFDQVGDGDGDGQGQAEAGRAAHGDDGARHSKELPVWLLEAAKGVSRDRRMCREVHAPKGGFVIQGAKYESFAASLNEPAVAFGRSPFDREFQYFAIRIGEAPKQVSGPGADSNNNTSSSSGGGSGGGGSLGPIAFGVCFDCSHFDPCAPCGAGTVIWRMGPGGGSGGTLDHNPEFKVVEGDGPAGGIKMGFTFGSVIGVRVERNNGNVAFFKDRGESEGGNRLEQIVSIEGCAAGVEVRPFIAAFAKGVNFEVLQQPAHPKVPFTGEVLRLFLLSFPRNTNIKISPRDIIFSRV